MKLYIDVESTIKLNTESYGLSNEIWCIVVHCIVRLILQGEYGGGSGPEGIFS